MNEILLKYGLPGVVIIALSWYIIHIEKEHKEERKEWQKSTEDMRESMDNNTAVLWALKTLLETFLIKK